MRKHSTNAPRLSCIAAAWTAAAAMGCGGDGPATAPAAPSLLAVQESTIAVGQSMTFVGANFFPTANSRTDIRFDGQFVSADGEVEAVRGLRVKPHRQDGNTVVWGNFGPFNNPFSLAGNRIGRFTGTATAITGATDGAPMPEVQSRPLLVDIDVAPSIVVKELRPRTNSTCVAPVKRVLGSFTYLITVEAVGFTPVNFTFAIAGEPGIRQPRIYRVPVANGQTSATFGNNPDLFFFEPVPLDLAYYVASLDVSAVGTDGQSRTARYWFGVHNPIEYITTGPAQTAQIYPAQSMSDCYSGGINGSTQTWTETTEETQTRQVGTHWDQSWLTAHSVTNTRTTTNQVTMAVTDTTTSGWQSGWNSSVTNSHEQADSNAWNWGVHADANVSVTVGVEGSAGIPGIAEVGASASTTAGISVGGNYGRSGNTESRNSVTGSYGETFEQNHSNSHAVTLGHDYSTSDTEGWTYEQSETVAMGGDMFWSVSTSTSNTHSTEVQVLPGQQAMVYRQRVRIQYPAVVVSYDLCGEPQVIADASFTDWKWAIAVEQGAACPPPPVHMQEPVCLLDCGGQ
jgi:hypothetical protein